MGGSTRAAGRCWPCLAALHRAAEGHGRNGQQPRPPEPDRRRTWLFTGIVEDLGEVEALEHLGDFARIYVRSTVVTQDARTGDSICVNGVCLTVTGFIGSSDAPRGFTAD